MSTLVIELAGPRFSVFNVYAHMHTVDVYRRRTDTIIFTYQTRVPDLTVLVLQSCVSEGNVGETDDGTNRRKLNKTESL